MSTLILVYVTVAEVPAIFTDAGTTMKGVEIGDHDIKQYFFVDNTTIFYKDKLFKIPSLIYRVI